MTSEKKLRQELEETKNELKKLQNQAKTFKKKPNEDEVKQHTFFSHPRFSLISSGSNENEIISRYHS